MYSILYNVMSVAVQVLLMGVLRIVALVYMMLFDRVVARGLAKEENKLKQS